MPDFLIIGRFTRMIGGVMKLHGPENFQSVEELGVMTNLKTRPKPVRRSLPTSQAYDLDAIVNLRRMPAAKKPKPPVSEDSMFFKSRSGDLDGDPFLQRLSRLT